MNGFAQKEKDVSSPLISQMIDLSQAMTLTQHLKSKDNVSKRERNVTDAERKVANHIISDDFLNNTKCFLYSKNHRETEYVPPQENTFRKQRRGGKS